MKPGHGEVLIAEGDVERAEDEQRLIEEFRRQLDAGLWAAVPLSDTEGRRESSMVRQLVARRPPKVKVEKARPRRAVQLTLFETGKVSS